ncbi:MAG: Fic family protein [Patescibacteria group bacterium]|nr:Fic family protein [Patescibacteria group bacterium]
MNEKKESLVGMAPERVPINGDVLAYENTHRALQYADRQAGNKGPITEDTIKGIHRIVMTNLLPEAAAGHYRTLNVGINRASFVPPDWVNVSSLMAEFSQSLNLRVTGCSRGLDCLPAMNETSAFAHYAFVRIHPFEDGNGRTVRLLCDMINRKFHLRPIIVWPHEKDTYIEALRAVDNSGNLAHLELFLAQRLAEKYAGEKGPTREIYHRLQCLIIQKQREIREQRQAKDLGVIWPIFNQAAFD